MSDREKERKVQKANDTENVEVKELDDKGLEKASGGGAAGEIQPVDDINQFQCYC